jgi:hypothetical protein
MSARLSGQVIVALAYPFSERVKAACSALSFSSVAAFWAGFMLKVGLFRPETPASGRPPALGLSVLAVPFLLWGWGYWRRLIASTPELIVDANRLVIRHQVLLSGPLTLPRSHVSCVAVDDIGVHDGQDKLRFPMMVDTQAQPAGSNVRRWLYSRFAGAPLPLLDTREELPNVAVLFKGPTLIDVARHARRRPLQVNGGRTSLYRREPVIGLLLRVAEPDRIREALARWGVARDVAEGDLAPGLGVEGYPSLAQPDEGPSEQPPQAVGELKRRASPIAGLLGLAWLLAVAAHARHSAVGAAGVVIAVVVGVLARMGLRAGKKRTDVGRLGGQIPFWARALLLYPAVSSLLFAGVLAISEAPTNRAAAYLLFPLVLTSVLVLIDASAERAPSNSRVGWAIAASIPALALSALALTFVT